MGLTHEEITALKKEIIDECRGVFVQIDDCNEKQLDVNKKFANDDTRIKLFEQKLESWSWMFKLIATGTIGTLVTSLASLIIK